MGRQVGFHALPDDLGEFLQFVCTENPVIVTVMDSDRAEIEPLANPRSESRVMTLWHQALIPALNRELVRRPPGSDYYRIPYSLPVLELSPAEQSVSSRSSQRPGTGTTSGRSASQAAREGVSVE